MMTTRKILRHLAPTPSQALHCLDQGSALNRNPSYACCSSACNHPNPIYREILHLLRLLRNRVESEKC